MKKLFGATISYYIAILYEVLVFKAPVLEVSWPGGAVKRKTLAMVAANIEDIGGATMRIAPGALIRDQKMYTAIVPEYSRWEILLKMFPHAGTGKFLERPGVQFFTCSELRVDAPEKVRVAIDGDIKGTTPVTIRHLPGEVNCVINNHRSPEKF